MLSNAMETIAGAKYLFILNLIYILHFLPI